MHYSYSVITFQLGTNFLPLGRLTSDYFKYESHKP